MKTLHQTLRAIAVPALAMLLPFAALAAPVTVDVTGAEAHFELGDSTLSNTVLLIDVGANAKITGFSFDAIITAQRGSPFSEMGFFISDSSLTGGGVFKYAADDSSSGTKPFANTANLDLMVGDDGILRLEFFAGSEDRNPGPESFWNSGAFIFNVETEAANTVPEPASLALVALALGAAGASSAKRRRQTR